ncbi:MAG: AraC family transcriptional regulator [Crocinitomicaceae bacterium]|nr:AraC family transcriptional regulator [Crocinitomicaceae bacterium]
MRNIYEVIKGSLHFKKFTIDDLVCVEYTCPLEDEHLGVFAQHDYIIHVLSGMKKWKTVHGEWEVDAGSTLFVKKGAAVITQSFDEDFCMLGFFMPDDLIKDSLLEHVSGLNTSKRIERNVFTATLLEREEYLSSFFQSMLAYFHGDQDPPDSIVRLKLKELLINVMHNSKNDQLLSYLSELTLNANPSLTHIMENNYCFNMSLEEFAKLCHRSLSTFKRDFFNHYSTTPGKWLLSKRLDRAATMILIDSSDITQVAFESGFEDASHFSRAFKDQFGVSPSKYVGETV